MKQYTQPQQYGMGVPEAAPISPTPTYHSSSTMESTASPSRSTSSIGSYEADDEAMREFKSEYDIHRERGAHARALALLTVTAGPSSKVDGLSAREAAIQAYKEKKREKTMRGVETSSRAVALLDVTVGNGNQQPGSTGSSAGLTPEQIRLAAIQAYKQKKRDEELYGKPKPKLVVPARTEHLATSNYKPKQKAPEADSSSDSVADMKCKYDLDREQEAKLKALNLLRQGLLS